MVALCMDSMYKLKPQYLHAGLHHKGAIYTVNPKNKRTYNHIANRLFSIIIAVSEY